MSSLQRNEVQFDALRYNECFCVLLQRISYAFEKVHFTPRICFFTKSQKKSKSTCFYFAFAYNSFSTSN